MIRTSTANDKNQRRTSFISSTMSSLDDLSRRAQRYHLKRARSNSPSGPPSSSSSSSASSSGYGSILSEDEAEDRSNQLQNHSQTNDVDPHPTRNHSNRFCDSEGLKLDANNKGMKLLLKMGWVQGNGLGVAQNGRREPIPTPAQTPLLGLGKATQDAYMLSNAISKPKELESLIIAREDEEAKVKREEKVKEIQTRVVEREDRLKTFHCHTCDKGYTTISQFEEHERSYAHHHAKRALEAKEARKVTGRSTEAKIDKERKREAKELQRMARAAGMSLEPSRSSGPLPKPEITKSSATDGFKKPSSGWTKLGSSSFLPTSNELETLNSSTRDQDPAGPPSSNQIIDGDKSVIRSRFKSTGFAPITTGPPVVASGFKPIGRTNTEPSQTTLTSTSTSRLDMPAPRFVTSSLQTGPHSKPTSFLPATKEFGATDGHTKEPTLTTPTSDSAPPSKFAQIAARLAARKANAALASGGPTANSCQVDPSQKNLTPKDQYDSEIERMLDI